MNESRESSCWLLVEWRWACVVLAIDCRRRQVSASRSAARLDSTESCGILSFWIAGSLVFLFDLSCAGVARAFQSRTALPSSFVAALRNNSKSGTGPTDEAKPKAGHNKLAQPKSNQ